MDDIDAEEADEELENEAEDEPQIAHVHAPSHTCTGADATTSRKFPILRARPPPLNIPSTLMPSPPLSPLTPPPPSPSSSPHANSMPLDPDSSCPDASLSSAPLRGKDARQNGSHRR
ncbi:hypothetical protein BDZ89DRAFT_1051246 [Hymenopellis radicata]|nr:hypothetical protein BDZ89DRAFT_1051246 [Hymenopellis radicata]